MNSLLGFLAAALCAGLLAAGAIGALAAEEVTVLEILELPEAPQVPPAPEAEPMQVAVAPQLPVVEAAAEVTAEAAVDPAPVSELVTLDYRDADLSNVLRSLSYSYNLNLVTSGDVSGKVTVNLKDVTVDEALQAILLSNGLVYVRKGNVIYISTGTPEAVNLESRPVRLKYIKAADAQRLLRKVLSPKGDMKVDDVSNTLLVTDFPTSINKLEKLLLEMDVPPRQVLIEAKIVDITSKDLRNLGITWTADYQPAGEKPALFKRNTKTQEQLKTTFTMAGTSSQLSGGQFKIDTLTLKGLSVTATLDALISDQKAQLLASPSIAALNNQEARIVIGEKVPFKERTQTTTGTTETTKFIDVGVTLRVTPSINADGYITMRIHPEVSSVSALLDAGPRITTREADTTVRVKEGETIVIAGLIRQEDNRSKSGVPFLGRLPVLDYLFGSRSRDKTQTELAVFVTPTLLQSPSELEGLSVREIAEREAYITVPTAGRLGLVYALFEKADQLQQGLGLESVRKPNWFRLNQAMELYHHIFMQFPNSPQAPEALYRIAQIYMREYKDLGKARVILQQLLENYSEGPVVHKAQKLLYQVEIAIEEAANQPNQKNE